MAAEIPPAATRACVVTWAPTTAARRRQRGFDHAELLAAEVAAALGSRAMNLLRRHPGIPQTGLTPGERRANRPRFTVAAPVDGSVLIVDDVVTTGTTLSTAGECIVRAGAASVIGVSAAATPLKHTPD